MDPARKAALEDQSQTIRTALKEWEHQWSASHGGSKPSRDAIKANPDIARKYKEYNKLRDILSGRIKDDSTSTKRKTAPAPVQTPVKRSKYSRPTETRQKEDIPPVASTPSRDNTAPSPIAPTSIGPTPHRDGKVLGLFAFLDSNVAATPSRKTEETQAKFMETPSRGDELENFKLGRTPTSSSKRQYLDLLVTPLKATDGNARSAQTPQSVSKLQFGTPAFLRRKTLPAVEETEEYESPQKLRRISRKPFARGLSAIVANLRKVEEAQIESQFEDDEAAMREMEAEMFAPSQPAFKRPATEVVVPDSQPAMKLLGGFDDEAAYDSPVEEQTDRGLPVKEYKKKAPKRTTRRVIMRPIFGKRPAEESVGEDDVIDEEDAAVPETQVTATMPDMLEDDSDDNSDFVPDHTEGDEVTGADLAKAIRAGRKRSAKTQGDEGAKEKDKDKDKDEGKVRKVARKVNELAHANFRRLKLRNNGAKGGPGYNSRFRRRR
ncbi:hypothetical protein jhhlp_002980 [Lomentospora prolificans]|uniref:DNA replication regulator SLD2 n=1 Tax=Lomentospora prolificans TaxID=41688 RepID=A0A2N3NFJ5_9PEZI|nr:hypothetical protein jhhlp_002980 [Lomentospora prolificans]